tara:strand:- start:1145 stop:1297 length:153 start_codon:yes stop_codon:yes gene_type:complete
MFVVFLSTCISGAFRVQPFLKDSSTSRLIYVEIIFMKALWKNANQDGIFF